MATFPLDGFDGYTSKTFIFKTDPDGNSIHTDVVYPTQAADSPSTVLVHYHGGFLVSTGCWKSVLLLDPRLQS